MKEIIALIAEFDSKYLLIGNVWLSVLLSAVVRSGMHDAFIYKKTKQQKKDDWNALPLIKKFLLLPSDLKPTNAPCHMRLFWRIRLCNCIFILCLGIIIGISETMCTELKQYSNIAAIAKVVLLDFPFMMYGICHPSGNKDSIKGWNFDSCKKP